MGKSDINKVFFQGNVVRDAEIAYPQNGGNPICTFDLASNEYWKKNGNEESYVSFMPIVLFGKLGEAIVNLLKKGKPVFVEGKLHQDRWDDQDTRKPRSAVKIIATDVKLLPQYDKKGGDDPHNYPDDPENGYNPGYGGDEGQGGQKNYQQNGSRPGNGNNFRQNGKQQSGGQRQNNGGNNQRNNGNGQKKFDKQGRELFPAICSHCGNETMVPFQPTGDKPIACPACFKRNRAR